MLILRELTLSDENAFMSAVRAWPEHELDWISFDWRPGVNFSDHLAKLKRDSLGIGLAEGRVPHTMLYGFVDNAIVGRVSVRHQLNDHLSQRGGHVGYAVNPDQRRKGYASEMFKQALQFLHHKGLDKVLVTTSETNLASWKIIEKHGGLMENKIWDSTEKTFVRRYWVDTKN